MSELDTILDDLFHGAAFAAFVEEAIATGTMPCPNATKYRAYRYYEEALSKKNQDKFLLETNGSFQQSATVRVVQSDDRNV